MSKHIKHYSSNTTRGYAYADRIFPSAAMHAAHPVLCSIINMKVADNLLNARNVPPGVGKHTCWFSHLRPRKAKNVPELPCNHADSVFSVLLV